MDPQTENNLRLVTLEPAISLVSRTRQARQVHAQFPDLAFQTRVGVLSTVIVPASL